MHATDVSPPQLRWHRQDRRIHRNPDPARARPV